MERKQQDKIQPSAGGPGFKTVCGGQALIEGIMMRGPKKQAIVIRKPDGELEIQEKEIKLIKERYPVLGVPVIRGVVGFWDSMYNGVTALMYSAEFVVDDEAQAAQATGFEGWLERKLGDKATAFFTTIAVLLGIFMSIALFFFLPTLLGVGVTWLTDSMLARNLVENILKMVIFIAYLALCSRMKDMRRVFSYHGAEHKTIACYEAGLPLCVEQVRLQPRQHPRCGTSFLFVVIFISMLVSTVVFSIWPVHNALLRMLVHLILLPAIVGFSYEINRYVGRHDTGISRALRAPGLWMQNLTTFEPDDSMIEVGIAALQLVLPEEQGADRW